MKPFDFDWADGSSGGVTAWVASALMTAFGVVACATAVPVPVPAAGAACATVSGAGAASSACATPVSETPASAGSPHASSIFDAVPIVFCFFIVILVLC